MKGIKGMLAMAVAVVATAIWADSATRLENGFSWSDSGDVVPGEWTSQYQKAMDLATEKHIPIVAFFGKVDCGYCKKLEAGKVDSKGTVIDRGVIDPEYAAILKKRGYILLAGITGVTTDASKVLKLCQTGTKLPFCGIYWPKENEPVFQKKFTGRMGSMPSKVGSTTGEQFINSLYMYLKDYVSYNGGKFTAPDEPFNRMECEDATGTVNVEMVRDEFSSAAANTVKITYPNGTTKSESISWAAGEKDKVLPVDVATAGFTADGQKVELKILDENGEEMSATHITYVKKAVSAGNPKWMTESFTFGEWTMNLDEAEKLVKKTEGAYTLAIVQGSLWCPDCGNVEKNFLAKKDKDGNNAFEKWAEGNKIALVAIDIPNFKSADIAAESPCLLKKDAYETAPSGEKMMHSGLGYLTRKGVSDTDAADVLERNHNLVTRNTDAGGFHRPEDKNAFRTGVPIFVLLDGDGKVRARLTRLATKSPTAELDDATFNAYLQRFNEMLKIADSWKTEIENNHPSASNPLTLAANGGSEDASLCHADMVDCFRLDGISGNAIEEVTVTGSSAATLIVEFCSLAKDGTVTSLANSVGKLSDGISLSSEFRETGDYFVRVSTPDKDKGKDDTLSDDFKLENAEQKFTSYTVTGTTVFVPQQEKAEVTTAALPESKTVSMKLTAGETYRITNFVSCDNLTKSGPDLYVASETCTAKVTVSGPFSYQIWKPGVIGFRDSVGTMVKSYCDIQGDNWMIPVQRAEGVSGSAQVKVSVVGVGELTTLDPAAFILRTPEITLGEGDAEKNVEIYVDDDPKFTYNRTIALKLELTNPGDVPGCRIAEDGAQHVLLVIEMDTKAPGRAMFSRTEPGYAKAKTVYVKEDAVCTLYAARIEDALGQQHVTIKSNLAGVRFDTDDWRDFGYATREEAAAKKAELGSLADSADFYWSDYEINEKPIYVSGMKAGKTAKITMTAFNAKGTKSKDQFKVVSASNSVSIVGIAADAPEFASEVQAKDTVHRYVAYEKRYPVNGTTGGAVTFTKVSGSLPSGLKVSWDEASKSLVVSGIPTVAAKYGKDFTAVYQVVEKRNGKKVPGLTTQLSYTVVDPVYADKKEGSPKAINPACVKSRTISDIMVFNSDATTGWLVGTLKLTLPANGKVSGKFACALGTVSLSGKNWSELKEDGTLCCALAGTGKFKDFTADVAAHPDGSIDVGLSDGEEGDFVMTSVPAVLWSATHTAEDCKGYYTVSLPVRTAIGGGLDITGPGAEHASRGSAYLALTMTSASQFKSGTMKWAGVLPNGTSVSGSSTLTEEQRANKNCVYLPFVKFAKKDNFAGVVEIARGASAMDEEECHETVSHPEIDLGEGIGERPIYTTWSHTENSNKTDLGDYDVRFDAFGGIFDKNLALDCCCTEGRGTDVMTLTVDMPKVASDYYGVLGPVTPIGVKIEADRIVRLDSTGGPQKITLSYAKATGLVSGTFKLPYVSNGVTKTLSASYKGIVLLGFGNSCGCQESSQPFVSGAWTFSDKIVYGEGKYLSVKRGDKVTIDVPAK